MDLQIFKGRWGEKRGGRIRYSQLPSLTGSLCVCMCVSACRHVCVRECFLKNLYLLFSEAHIIFGNGIKPKKKHEKCLFSLSACSFIHFPASWGAFSSPKQTPPSHPLPNWTKGGWEWKEEAMGCFRWDMHAAVFTTAAGKFISFV